jgi:nitrogen regulatory protein P-II 1
MKLVKCIIQPDKQDDVVTALQSIATGMTVWDVRGHGHQRGRPLVYRGIEYAVALLPKVMIEIVADDNRIDDIIKVIIETAKTGNIGDGRIFIELVEETYHIRTGFMELG